jgi:uncharacterized protein YdaU (DUF1376 family)
MSDLRALPYYKWFWQDWRANRKAQRMSYIERGLYRELLDECWVEGSIPNDIASLAEICGCPKDVMASAWQVLESCFELLEGKYINKKMESMRTEKDAERLAKSQSGKKGGVSKSMNSKPKKSIAKQVVASAKQVLAPPNIEEKRREEKSNPLLPEFLSSEMWSEWIQHRKSIKAPMSDLAQAKFINQLTSLVADGHDSKKLLDTAIANGWKTVYPKEETKLVKAKKDLPPEWRVG